jgi:hypothetical protein
MSLLPFLGSGFQGRTLAFLWVPELSPTWVTSFYQQQLTTEPQRFSDWLLIYQLLPDFLKVKVILLPTVSRPVCLGVKHPSGTRDQFFSFFLQLFLDGYGIVDVGLPLWREVGFLVFSCRWASSAQPFPGLSPMGLMSIFYLLYFWNPQPGGPGSCIYFPQEQGSPITPPVNGYWLSPLTWPLQHLGTDWAENTIPLFQFNFGKETCMFSELWLSNGYFVVAYFAVFA